MAQTYLERTVANRGRQKMSAKQIRYFGTKRQRASLKASRRSKPRHRPRTKSNRGEIIGLTYPYRSNSGTKKGRHMAAPKKHKKARRYAGYGHTKKRKNPGRPKHHSYGHRRRPRRNPGRRHYRRNPGMGQLGGIAINAVFTVAGAVGSRLLTQMVLGTNNAGPIGYAGNAVAGGILWFLAEKVMKNRAAAHGIIAGTAVGIVLRLINDYTPFGQYLAAQGFGDYQMQSFVTPQVLVDPFNSAEIQIPAGYRALQAPAASGVGAWSDYGSGSDY
jgi:hypothetical protein